MDTPIIMIDPITFLMAFIIMVATIVMVFITMEIHDLDTDIITTVETDTTMVDATLHVMVLMVITQVEDIIQNHLSIEITKGLNREVQIEEEHTSVQIQKQEQVM